MQPDTSSDSPARRGADIRTFLFADLRGYTRYTQERGDDAASALAGRFADLVKETVREYECELLELRGDEALCVFRSARQALRASVELQRRLRTATDERSAFPIGVGMGLDAGEAVPTQGGYRGASLNLAARLCARAAAGQILATDGVTHLAQVVDGLTYRSLRPVQLKGLQSAVRPVEVVPADPLPPLPAPDVPRPQHRKLAAAAAVVAAAAVAAGIWAANRGSPVAKPLQPESFALVGQSGSASAVTGLGQPPHGVAFTGSVAWLPLYADGQVLRVDTATGSRERLSVGAGPDAVAAGGGEVWVANSGDGTVSELNTSDTQSATGAVTPIYVGNGPSGLVYGDGRVWVALSVDGAVARIDAQSGKLDGTFQAGTDPTRVAFGLGSVWVTNESVGTVTPIDPATGTAGTPIPVGHGPNGIAVGDRAVWVTNSLDGTISRIDPQTKSVTGTFPVGDDPAGAAVVGPSVWVATAGRVTRLVAATGQPQRALAVRASPQDMAADEDHVGITTSNPPTGHRGGTLTIAAPPMAPSIDPASTLAWHPQPWETLALTNDGLVGFKRVTGPDGVTVVADLARSLPTPADGGRTYSFQLRSGIRYSNGEPVRASDIRNELERTIDLTPGLGYLFYHDIAGEPQCGHPCNLSGVQADDANGTIIFHLSQPDPDFLQKLAMPFAVAVPPSVPNRDMLTHPVPATGPYMITSYSPQMSVVLKRNPYFRVWSRDAQPAGYPDAIVWRAYASPDAAVSAVERGRADLLFDRIPPGRQHEVNTTYASQLHPQPEPTTFMMNIGSGPLNGDHAARRAIAFAADRAQIATDAGGRPSCQVLPPNFPGYRPYCPYTVEPGSNRWVAPDIALARSIEQHAPSRGRRILITSEPNGTEGPAGHDIVKLLDSLGYHTAWTHNPGAAGAVQVFAYVADYPGAADFLNTLTGSTNTHAIAAATRSPYGGTLAWAAVDRQVTDDARLIGLASIINPGLTSRRVGNYLFAPVLGHDPIIDQMWVK